MGSKIDAKAGSKFKSAKVASWKRLGSILYCFGGRPGSIFLDFLLVFILFPENPCFSCQEASKSDPGAKKTEKWSQKASQNDPKMDQKRCRNSSPKMVVFDPLPEVPYSKQLASDGRKLASDQTRARLLNYLLVQTRD